MITWILVAIVVYAIYNAERLPDILNKVKKDMPQTVETVKKVSKELKEKAQATAAEKKQRSPSPKKDDEN